VVCRCAPPGAEACIYLFGPLLFFTPVHTVGIGHHRVHLSMDESCLASCIATQSTHTRIPCRTLPSRLAAVCGRWQQRSCKRNRSPWVLGSPVVGESESCSTGCVSRQPCSHCRRAPRHAMPEAIELGSADRQALISHHHALNMVPPHGMVDGGCALCRWGECVAAGMQEAVIYGVRLLVKYTSPITLCVLVAASACPLFTGRLRQAGGQAGGRARRQ
jgi:hypothetical protein